MAVADECLRRPRRKPKAKLHLHESPFPIPIQTLTGKKSSDKHWYYYFGTLESDHVSISRLGDLTFLYRLGFFGKGILSRSQPQFEKYNDVLSDKGIGRYLSKFSRWEPEDRDSQISVYTDIVHERLRQHQAWVEKESETEKNPSEKEEGDVISHSSSAILPQCVDLQTEVDDELAEECSSESDDEVIQPPSKRLQTDDSLEGESVRKNKLKKDEANDESTQTEEPMEAEDTIDSSCDGGIAADIDNSLKRPLLETSEDVHDKLLKLDDKYKVYECLQLTFEEAFFLSYGLGCLAVTDTNTGENMSLTQMWQTFSRQQKNFIPMYAAYHHFRSKGWVVRFSKTYGLDFVLYQDGMAFHHASYCVNVRFIKEGKLESDQKSDSEPGFELTWQNLAAMCRVNERAGKEVLLCYVIQPRDMDEEDLRSPACIKRLKIMETAMRRWAPEKFRESKE